MQKPNFILFITDQQKADHLGAYGNKVVKTPYLDQLAERGWCSDRFYVASPICMPNRSSLMTGRMPSLHGARHNGIPLPLGSNTFVETLRKAGWGTALVGKSHLQNISGLPAQYPNPDSPSTQGEALFSSSGRYDQEWGPAWDSDPNFQMQLPFYGFDHVDLAINHGDQVGGDYARWLTENHPEVAAITGPEHAIPTPDFELSHSKQAWRTRVPEDLSTTAWVAQRTKDHLAKFKEKNQPFFIQCSFPDPHHPFTPSGSYWDMYDPNEVDLPYSFYASNETSPPEHVQWLRQKREQNQAIKHTPALFACTEREAREAIALNYGSITHIDDRIGEVLKELERLGLAENTVVLFMSDHGDYLGDHQLLWKGPIHYQSVIRTPFIWMDPLNSPTIPRSHALCSTIDVAPTILQRAGVIPYNGIQGQSLLSLIQRENNPVTSFPFRQAVLIEEEGQRVLFGMSSRCKLRTIVTDKARLSLYEGSSFGELYDLQQDPFELHNLWHEKAAQALKSQMLEQLALSMMVHSETSPYPSALA